MFHELIELIVHKQVEGNEKSFFDDMDHIYTAGERDGLHESVDSTHGNTS